MNKYVQIYQLLMLGFAFHILELPTLYHQVEQQGQNWLQNTFDWISDNFYKHFSLLLFSLVLSSLRLFFFYHSLVYRNAESEFYGSEKNFQRLIRVKISCYLSRLIKVSEIKRSRIISIQCLKPALTVSLSGSNLTNFGSTLYFLRNRALFSWKS